MVVRLRALVVLCLLAFAAPASAQPLAEPVDASAPAPARPPVRELPAPGPVTPRPDPGPSMKERGARTRRANPASGVLFVAVLVGAMGYWVLKRFKRY